MTILGIHSGHDASLALVVDGRLISSISVERYSRNKKDVNLSREALDRFLSDNGITLDAIDIITMGYWNQTTSPWISIYSPHEQQYPLRTMGTYNQESAIMNHLDSYSNKIIDTEYGYTLPSYIDRIQPPYNNTIISHTFQYPLNCVIDGYDRVIGGYFVDHHTAHAAAAYYTSPFKQSAVMTVDASMHDSENCSGYYIGNEQVLGQFRTPGLMIGTFYDAATEFLGLGPGTLKAGVLMGLAAYGNVSGHVKENADEWTKPIWDRNSPNQDHQYIDWLFSQVTGRFPLVGYLRDEIINGDVDAKFFTREFQTVWKKGDYDKQEVMDAAANIQYLLEYALVKYANTLYDETKEFNGGNLCLAGGTVLNCNANYKILTETKFENVHFFPACGDDGIAAGSALYYLHFNQMYPRVDYTTGELAYLGVQYPYQPESEHTSQDLDLDVVAQSISEGKIVCWYQGRSEIGPRALGNRSFISDPRNKDMRDILNSRVKFREWFRPFAPVVLSEDKEEWFTMDFDSPFMLHTVPCKKPQEIPSGVHIDNTSRVQTLTRDHNPIFYDLISKFKDITGVPVVLNTSLNVKGQPIVETPEEAMKLFNDSDVDVLVINDKMYFK